MSRNLRFWNEKETDVLIEYKLQFGHILMPQNKFELFLKNIRKVFNLKKPVNVFKTLNTDVLPYHEPQKTFLLNDEKVWHFIFAEFAKDVLAIYAPHFLFFNNSRWIKFSKLMKTFLIASEQFDDDLFHYTIFERGKLFCNAYFNSEGIHKSTHAPVDVYLNNELIYHKDDDSKDLTPEFIEMISSDVVIANDTKRGIKFLSPIKNNEIRPISTYHVVFEADGN